MTIRICQLPKVHPCVATHAPMMRSTVWNRRSHAPDTGVTCLGAVTDRMICPRLRLASRAPPSLGNRCGLEIRPHALRSVADFVVRPSPIIQRPAPRNEQPRWAGRQRYERGAEEMLNPAGRDAIYRAARGCAPICRSRARSFCIPHGRYVVRDERAFSSACRSVSTCSRSVTWQRYGNGEAALRLLQPLVTQRESKWPRIATVDGEADVYGIDNAA